MLTQQFNPRSNHQQQLSTSTTTTQHQPFQQPQHRSVNVNTIFQKRKFNLTSICLRSNQPHPALELGKSALPDNSIIYSNIHKLLSSNSVILLFCSKSAQCEDSIAHYDPRPQVLSHPRRAQAKGTSQ